MVEPSASSKAIGQDFLVGICGFVSSALTAVILRLVEEFSGVAVYTWMLWFVIPVGAGLAGFAGATGYYAGSWFFGHRPTRLYLERAERWKRERTLTVDVRKNLAAEENKLVKKVERLIAAIEDGQPVGTALKERQAELDAIRALNQSQR